MMRVIFLDMDGVLNSMEYFARHKKDNPGTDIEAADRGNDVWWLRMIDPEAVARLNRIIEATGAKVVISSSWRYHCDPIRMQRLLRGRGFKGEVIDRTPFAKHLPEGIRNLDGTRGHEISVWLTRNTHLHIADRFVILDDIGPHGFAHVAPHLVHTTWGRGLLDEHIQPAIEMLMGDEELDTP